MDSHSFIFISLALYRNFNIEFPRFVLKSIDLIIRAEKIFLGNIHNLRLPVAVPLIIRHRNSIEFSSYHIFIYLYSKFPRTNTNQSELYHYNVTAHTII